MRNALAILVAGALLAACGQRGPLYLPGEEREDVVPATPLAPAARAAPVASPLPPTAPSPAAATGDTTDESETARRNRAN